MKARRRVFEPPRMITAVLTLPLLLLLLLLVAEAAAAAAAAATAGSQRPSRRQLLSFAARQRRPQHPSAAVHGSGGSGSGPLHTPDENLVEVFETQRWQEVRRRRRPQEKEGGADEEGRQRRASTASSFVAMASERGERRGGRAVAVARRAAHPRGWERASEWRVFDDDHDEEAAAAAATAAAKDDSGVDGVEVEREGWRYAPTEESFNEHYLERQALRKSSARWARRRKRQRQGQAQGQGQGARARGKQRQCAAADRLLSKSSPRRVGAAGEVVARAAEGGAA